MYSGRVVDSCLHRNDKTKRYILFFLIHLNRKTSRIFSLNLMPKRCVLDLNSIMFKSSAVGLAGDFPNTDNKPAASKLKNEFVLTRKRILIISGLATDLVSTIFVPPISDRLTIPGRFCLSIRICRTIVVCPEFPVCNHSIVAPPRHRPRQHRWFCIGYLKAMS